MTARELGSILRFRRELLRLRQEDLSEISGIGLKTIHLVEKGEGNPSFETLEKLLEVLGMELSVQVKKLNL